MGSDKLAMSCAQPGKWGVLDLEQNLALHKPTSCKVEHNAYNRKFELQIPPNL